MKATTFKIIGLAFFVVAIATGCGKMNVLKGGSGKDADNAIAAAQTSMAKAKKLKWIWRDTGKLLKGAKKARKSGDNKKATKLANAAKFQADMAIEQYYAEKKIDRSKYMRR